jgi:hypothetical protein
MTQLHQYRSRPGNEEAHGSPQTAGLMGNVNKQRDSSDPVLALQSVDQIDNAFNRLVRKFSEFGIALYPLSGDSLLASAPAIGMSLTLPDLRAAHAYLRQIGGVQ